MGIQGNHSEPYNLCDHLDLFLSDRGRSLFPEHLSLERKYLSDPLVQVDRELLQRVFFVMLSSLFTTGSAGLGGTVKIIVSPHEEDLVKVSLSYEPATASAPAVLPDTEDLASATDLLSRCGGSLSFSGRSGNSSLIVFTIPTCGFEPNGTGDECSELHIEPLPHPGTAALSVLIADDEAPIRDLLGTIISSAGITIIDYARNGEEACVKAFARNYDLIFMDIAMPVLTGREAFKRIVSQIPDARIVFITGLYNDDEIPEVTDDLDSYGYIKKPFNIIQIRSILEKVLTE